MIHLLKNHQRILYFIGIYGKTISITILILLICGCTPTIPNSAPIYGTVTLDGVPIESGNIMFFEKNTDQSYGTVIRNGKYKLNILPGEKKVCISATGQAKTVPRNDFPGDTTVDTVYESIIPEKYNTRTTLSCITDSKGGEQNFDLLSK